MSRTPSLFLDAAIRMLREFGYDIRRGRDGILDVTDMRGARTRLVVSRDRIAIEDFLPLIRRSV